MLAFLAIFEQKLPNHINAMFCPADLSIMCQQPRWQSEGHQGYCKAGFVQGSLAQDHLKYALHCAKFVM